MKLTSGTCDLCAVSDQVIVPFSHTKIAAFLPETLKSYIGVRTIEEISLELQVCSFCLAHMLQVVQYEESLGKFSTSIHRCSICRNVEHLVIITEWPHFDVLLENINAKRRNKCAVCLPCIAYLDRLNVVKGHLLKRISKLQNCRSSTAKPQISRKKLPRNKRRLENQWKLHNGPNVELKPKTRSERIKAGLALNHLKPLKYSDFNVDQYKNDPRLLNQIAFVSLKSALTSVRVPSPVKEQRKNQKRAKTTDISKNSVSTPSQFPFKIMLKSSNQLANKIPNKQVKLKPKTCEPKRILKTHLQDPQSKQLIVRILRTNLEELSHTTQYDVDKANVPTEGDVELKSQNIDETQELFTDDSEENTSESLPSEENSLKTLKRKRRFSNQTKPEESNSEMESDELNSRSLKKLKVDAIVQAKNYGSEPVDEFDALWLSVKVSANKDSEDPSNLEITLGNLESNRDEDNSSSCSTQTEVFTGYNQMKSNDTKEIRRLSTLDSDIEVIDSQIENSSEDTIVMLAELREAPNTLGVIEDDSHIDNSQLIEENSATYEKNLTDITEKPLEAEEALKDVENVEADNCEKDTKYVESEDDDCLPDNLYSEIEITDEKLESSTEEAIDTLAEPRKAQISDGANSFSGTEYDSDTENSQLIQKNSATHEEPSDKNEGLFEDDVPNDVEHVEADHCETDTIKSVEDEEYDCLPDNLHLHLDIEPTKDDNSTCTPPNEGSDPVV